VAFETSRGSPTPNYFLLFVQKKVIKENHTPLPLVSFGLSAASGRLRNSLRSNSPRRSPSAAQAEGAAKGIENHALEIA
jgi:hypothetical protein